MTFYLIARDAAVAVAPFALAAATALLGKGAQYALHAVASIKNQAVRNALDWAINQAHTLVREAVVAANQTTVNGLKASGQWSATTGHTIFQNVLATVEANLTQDARTLLTQALPDLPAYLGTLIEQQVAVAPNKTSAAKTSAPAISS